MKMNRFFGLLAFLIVLFTMPLGHALMILMEHILGDSWLFLSALIMGFVGVIFLFVGMLSSKRVMATIWGLFAGLFVWTGWIEFAYVYYAQRYGIAPLIENGEIVTKPEYLIMPSSVGFWATLMIFYFVGTKSACSFFNWFQKLLGKTSSFQPIPSSGKRNVAVTTFMEMMLLLWTSYLILLFAYDSNFFGDRSWLTYFLAFGSLAWSIYLFIQLMKKKQLDYAIRYAIPVVIIFWTFVEIMGRWNLLKEIWVEPWNYKYEMLAILGTFVIGVGLALRPTKKKAPRKQKVIPLTKRTK